MHLPGCGGPAPPCMRAQRLSYGWRQVQVERQATQPQIAGLQQGWAHGGRHGVVGLAPGGKGATIAAAAAGNNAAVAPTDVLAAAAGRTAAEGPPMAGVAQVAAAPAASILPRAPRCAPGGRSCRRCSSSCCACASLAPAPAPLPCCPRWAATGIVRLRFSRSSCCCGCS